MRILTHFYISTLPLQLWVQCMFKLAYFKELRETVELCQKCKKYSKAVLFTWFVCVFNV